MAKLPTATDIFSDQFRRPVLYNPNAKTWCYVSAKGEFVPISGAAPTIPSGGQNVYPLRMPSNVPAGAPVTIGAGADEIKIQISNNPASVPEHGLCNFNVAIDGVVVAAELSVTDVAGMDHGQVFTLKGAWGPLPHKVKLTSSLLANGLHDSWLTAVTYNGTQLVYNGPSVDARGAKPPPNATSIWNNLGNAVEFSDTLVVVAPELPAPDQTIVTGALINGASVAPATLADLVAATPKGGVLKLPAGRFVGTSPVGAITIEGQAGGGTVIDASGLRVAFGKGIFCPTESGFVGRWLKLTGASGPDGNAAGVRQNGDGIDFTMEDCEVTSCQDGLLTFSGHVVLNRCNFHDNGNSDGLSHEVYFGGANGLIEATDCTFTCGTKSSHAFKSRFPRNILRNCAFAGNGDDGRVGGSVIDFPDGGVAEIHASSVAMGAGAGNRQIIGFGLESQRNAAVGMSLLLDSVALDSKGSEGGGYVQANGAGDLTLNATTYTGATAPQVMRWATVTGEMTPSA